MEFKSQATLLYQFLMDYYPMWNQEVMDEYPTTINDYPQEWIQELDLLSTDELFQIDSKQSLNKLKDGNLKNFIKTIQELSFISKIDENSEFPLEDWAFVGVKHKKRHEIQKIVPVIKQVYLEKKFHHINDIGGGVGHLSRILAHYHAIPTYSIDQNKDFQDIGEKRMERYRKLSNAAEVKFINMKFGENHHLNSEVFSSDSFTLGLHTCGSLATTLITENIKFKTKGLLNFGCCYHLMTNKTFQSDFYNKNNFKMINLYGRTLATRSHAETNYSNFLKKITVKYYRYGLHLFLMKNFNRKDCVDVGECPITTYDRPFSDYLLLKLKDLNISHSFSAEKIEQFYYSQEIQAELRKMFLCNIIRWQLGRALEVFLLLDRCLYLLENGYCVEIKQYFREDLSPRNIGIIALLS